MSWEAKSRSSGETQGETGKVRAAANDNALARIARDVRRTAFGWRHAQTVAAFADGHRQVLAAYDDLRERTRTQGDAVALSGAYRETLTRHAVLLKQAETFHTRPDEFALPAGRARRHRAQGPRRLRGPPCPGAAPPPRGHDAATCIGSSGRRNGKHNNRNPNCGKGSWRWRAAAPKRPGMRRYGDAGRGWDAVSRS